MGLYNSKKAVTRLFLQKSRNSWWVWISTPGESVFRGGLCLRYSLWHQKWHFFSDGFCPGRTQPGPKPWGGGCVPQGVLRAGTHAGREGDQPRTDIATGKRPCPGGQTFIVNQRCGGPAPGLRRRRGRPLRPALPTPLRLPGPAEGNREESRDGARPRAACFRFL